MSFGLTINGHADDEVQDAILQEVKTFVTSLVEEFQPAEGIPVISWAKWSGHQGQVDFLAEPESESSA